MKILHAPIEIAGNMARICRHLRAAGVDATDVQVYDTWLKYRCSVNMHLNEIKDKVKALETRNDFIQDALDRYDIFHFHFGQSLDPYFRDLEVIKSRGKKIVVSFWGSDQRSDEWILYHQAKFLGYAPPKPYFLSRNHYAMHQIWNRYADVMLGLMCIPRGLWLNGMIDCDEWTEDDKERIAKNHPFEKDPDKTYFLHSASNNFKKGSYIIMKLLDECKAEGMPIETMYVSGVRPDVAKRIYAHADYAISQVGVGGFGLFGMEMMAWGIPVLTYMGELADRLWGTPPCLRILKENFKETIRRCIEAKKTSLQQEWANEAVSWVWEYCHMGFRIYAYVDLYEKLSRGERIPQYINQAWYDQEYQLQTGWKSEFYKYMIEKKVFEELGMSVPQYDMELYL